MSVTVNGLGQIELPTKGDVFLGSGPSLTPVALLLANTAMAKEPFG